MQTQNDLHLNSNQVRARYGNISPVTLYRWTRSLAGFPQPRVIQGRKFWRANDLDAWDASAATGEAA